MAGHYPISGSITPFANGVQLCSAACRQQLQAQAQSVVTAYYAATSSNEIRTVLPTALADRSSVSSVNPPPFGSSSRASARRLVCMRAAIAVLVSLASAICSVVHTFCPLRYPLTPIKSDPTSRIRPAALRAGGVMLLCRMQFLCSSSEIPV